MMKIPMEELYQEVILDHNRNPRHYGELQPHDAHAHGYNALCGDTYDVYLRIKNNRISDVGFTGQGCAISKASASMMTTKTKGLLLSEARDLANQFLVMSTQENVSDAQRSALGSLKIFEGVKKFPIRVKCATMAWHTLKEALETWRTQHE